MSNVVEFNGVTKLDIPADRVLSSAQAAGLADVVVLGYDADGEFRFFGSYAAGPETLWLLELAKVRLLKAAGE